MKFLANSKKSAQVIKIINEAIDILESVGIPLNGKTERSIERMAMAFLAVANVINNWQTSSNKISLKTRDIINFNNTHFEETISSGSYDDIRRKDLKLLVLGNLIINSADNLNAATNDPTRGYSLDTDFANLIRHYGTQYWHTELQLFLSKKDLLKDVLARNRVVPYIDLTGSAGKEIHSLIVQT